MKRFLVDIIQKTEIRATALKILRKFPKIKEMYTIPSSIDFERTIAHCTDLSGMKAYSYGGIKIIRENFTESVEYEKVLEEIIVLLSDYKLPDSDERIFEWVRRREEVYNGQFIEKYPDILFKLREGYGAGWAIYDSLLGISGTHDIHPGSHRIDTPVFLMSGLTDKKPARGDIELTDIAPTVLHLLGIKGDFGFDGFSLYT